MLASILASWVSWWFLAVSGCFFIISGTRLAKEMASLLRLGTIALPVILAFSVPISYLLVESQIDKMILPALVGALVVVAGWIVTFLFQELSRKSDQFDLMLVLRAEIWVIYTQLTDKDAKAYLEELPKLFAQDPTFRPFVPMPADPSVFQGVSSQLLRLPTAVVDDVVQFYSLLSDVKLFAEDLRSDAFSKLTRQRAEFAYIDYFETRLSLEKTAQSALATLENEIERASGFMRTRSSLNTPDAGRQGQEDHVAALVSKS